MYTKKLEAQLANAIVSCDILKAKFKRDAEKAQDKLKTLQAKYEMGEARIKALVAKHRLKLNQKVKETLARASNEWLAKAAEL